MGQPAVTGQLIAGILLGHSVFGVLWPDAQHIGCFRRAKSRKAMLDGISQLGILMLLLRNGDGTDLRLVRRLAAPAIGVRARASLSVRMPVFVLGEFLPNTMLPRPDLRIITSLFLALHSDRIDQDRGHGDPRDEFYAPNLGQIS